MNKNLTIKLGAIALLILLLLIPLSHRPMPNVPQPPQPRWVLPITVPTPPVPVPITPTAPKPPTAPIQQRAPITPVSPPMPTADAANQALPAADPVAVGEPTEIGPPQISPPLSGASLQYLRAPAPAYPRTALMDRLQGTVMLQVHVDIEGRPVSVDIAQSSGHRVLDQAARNQVLQHWRFRPAQQNGRAVEAIGLVPVAFSLGN